MNDRNVTPPRSDWFALNSRQRPIWLETTSSDQQVSPQFGGRVRIDARLDVGAFERAVSAVMSRHDSLRLRIDPTEPRQRIADCTRAPVEIIALPTGREDEFTTEIDRRASAPLELGETPLFAVYLAKSSDMVWFAAFRFHHLIADGLSCGHFWRDLAAFYDQFAHGRSTVSGSCHSIVDFCARDAAYLASGKHESDLAYWKARFQDLPPLLLEGATSRPQQSEGEGREILPMERAAYDAFLAACSRAGAGPTSVLSLLLGLSLTPANRVHDVVLGVAVAGRAKADADVVGQFGKLVPLRFGIDEATTLAELATRLEGQLVRDYRHHKLPLDALARELDLVREERRALFDVFLSFMPSVKGNYDFAAAGYAFEPLVCNAAEGFALAVYVVEASRSKAPFFEFAHDPDVVSKSEVDRIRSRLMSLIETFTQSPHMAVAALEAMRPAPELVALPTILADEQSASPPAWTIGLAATFTADPIVPTLKFWLNTLGIDARVDVVGYNQVFQALLDPSSLLRANRRGANLVIIRIQDWLRNKSSDDSAEADDVLFVADTVASLAEALAAATSAAPVAWLLMIAAPSPSFADTPVQIAGERALLALADSVNGLEVVHYGRVRQLYPVPDEFDQLGDELGHAPYNAGAYSAMGTALARAAHRRLRRPVKVIVADCDNTLWAGVVGEDGVAGVRVEPSHRALQERLVAAAQAGVLVCLASKNDWADVRAVFETRDDMVLRLDHIVASKVDWRPKSANIAALADELELGLDAFVFLDDNPIEIAEVESGCPGITAIRVPEGGAMCTYFVDHLWLLDTGRTTEEDAKRTRFYKENAQRFALRDGAADYAGFIESLNVEIAIGVPRDDQLDRCVQLTERTTQFNINGRKLAIADLIKRDGTDACLRTVEVKDRFGDYGLVGLIAARRDGLTLDVVSFLMSCRVLGRGVEHRMVAELGRIAETWACETVRFKVVASSRNQPVRQFLETLDATRTPTADGAIVLVASGVATSTRFNPDAQRVGAPKQTPTPTTSEARFVPVLPASTWSSIAAELDNVVTIGNSTRATLTKTRSAQTPYRSPRTATESMLATHLADALGVDRVGIDDDFIAMGLDSLPAVQLVASVRKRLGIPLSVRSLFETPTVAALAASLLGLQGESDVKALTPLQFGRPGQTPLFCFHPVGGDSVAYLRLARALGVDQPVYGLEAVSQADGAPYPESVEKLAASYVAEIRQAQPHGPYFLAGWSFGGSLAYEAACQLSAMGQEVGQLMLLDAYPPLTPPGTPDMTFEEAKAALVEVLAGFSSHLQGSILSERDKTLYRESVKDVVDIVKIGQRIAFLPLDMSEEDGQRKIELCHHLWCLERRWQPHPYDGEITYFRSTVRPDDVIDACAHWRTWASGPMDIVDVNCHHMDIIFEPHILVVAERIRQLLAPAVQLAAE